MRTTRNRAKVVKVQSKRAKRPEAHRKTIKNSTLKRFLRVLGKVLDKIETDLERSETSKITTVGTIIKIVTTTILIIKNL